MFQYVKRVLLSVSVVAALAAVTLTAAQEPPCCVSGERAPITSENASLLTLTAQYGLQNEVVRSDGPALGMLQFTDEADTVIFSDTAQLYRYQLGDSHPELLYAPQVENANANIVWIDCCVEPHGLAILEIYFDGIGTAPYVEHTAIRILDLERQVITATTFQACGENLPPNLWRAFVMSDGYSVTQVCLEGIFAWNTRTKLRRVVTQELFFDANPSRWTMGYSPATNVVALATSGRLALWDAAQVEAPLSVEFETYVEAAGTSNDTLPSSKLIFNQDGSLIASMRADDLAVDVWDAATGTHLYEVPGDFRPGVSDILFSPTDVLVVSEAHTFTLWNARTGEFLVQGDAGEQWITSLAFNPTGTMLVTGGHELLVWEIPS